MKIKFAVVWLLLCCALELYLTQLDGVARIRTMPNIFSLLYVGSFPLGLLLIFPSLIFNLVEKQFFPVGMSAPQYLAFKNAFFYAGFGLAIYIQWFVIVPKAFAIFRKRLNGRSKQE